MAREAFSNSVSVMPSVSAAARMSDHEVSSISMPAALRRRLVRAAARKVFGEGGAASEGSYVLSGEETAKVLALAGFGGVGGAVTGRIGIRLELHGGLRAERSAREIRMWRQG